MQYPRVVIIGETFRLNGGGGITLSNLYKDWPAENIGVITDNISETDRKTKYNYYQLGNEEIKFPFPFNFIQANFQSGPYYFYSENKVDSYISEFKGFAFYLKKKIRPIFDKSLSLLGLSYRFYSINVSETLIEWILKFNPDIIYIQPFLHKTMRFANSLSRKIGIPYAVHIMDDSVKYINKSLIFSRLYQRQIDKDFEQLIRNAKVLLSISEAMSEEYAQRYGLSFLSFRNPIDINKWLPHQKHNLSVSSEVLKIIYTGRLFSPTYHSLIDLCEVINRINRIKAKIFFHIYTHDKNLKFNRAIRKFRGVALHDPVDVDEMPRLIAKYDIFFMCLDFDNRAQKYSQFSISTRTSEGMISGVPILIYAPQNSGMFKYFTKTETGLVVGAKDKDQLEKGILRLWQDIKYRQKLSSNAIRTALSDSNSIKIRENFRRVLSYAKDESTL